MYGRRYKGLKKPSGVKHGIVRTFTNSQIILTQYKDDQMHGLNMSWDRTGDIDIYLYKNGCDQGRIYWNSDWEEDVE